MLAPSVSFSPASSAIPIATVTATPPSPSNSCFRPYSITLRRFRLHDSGWRRHVLDPREPNLVRRGHAEYPALHPYGICGTFHPPNELPYFALSGISRASLATTNSWVAFQGRAATVKTRSWMALAMSSPAIFSSKAH